MWRGEAPDIRAQYERLSEIPNSENLVMEALGDSLQSMELTSPTSRASTPSVDESNSQQPPSQLTSTTYHSSTNTPMLPTAISPSSPNSPQPATTSTIQLPHLAPRQPGVPRTPPSDWFDHWQDAQIQPNESGSNATWFGHGTMSDTSRLTHFPQVRFISFFMSRKKLTS